MLLSYHTNKHIHKRKNTKYIYKTKLRQKYKLLLYHPCKNGRTKVPRKFSLKKYPACIFFNCSKVPLMFFEISKKLPLMYFETVKSTPHVYLGQKKFPPAYYYYPFWPFFFPFPLPISIFRFPLHHLPPFPYRNGSPY